MNISANRPSFLLLCLSSLLVPLANLGCAERPGPAINTFAYAEVRNGIMEVYLQEKFRGDLESGARLRLYDGKSFSNYLRIGQLGRDGDDYVYRDDAWGSAHQLRLGPNASFSVYSGGKTYAKSEDRPTSSLCVCMSDGRNTGKYCPSLSITVDDSETVRYWLPPLQELAPIPPAEQTAAAE